MRALIILFVLVQLSCQTLVPSSLSVAAEADALDIDKKTGDAIWLLEKAKPESAAFYDACRLVKNVLTECKNKLGKCAMSVRESEATVQKIANKSWFWIWLGFGCASALAVGLGIGITVGKKL